MQSLTCPDGLVPFPLGASASGDEHTEIRNNVKVVERYLDCVCASGISLQAFTATEKEYYGTVNGTSCLSNGCTAEYRSLYDAVAYDTRNSTSSAADLGEGER